MTKTPEKRYTLWGRTHLYCSCKEDKEVPPRLEPEISRSCGELFYNTFERCLYISMPLSGNDKVSWLDLHFQAYREKKKYSSFSLILVLGLYWYVL